MQQPFELAGKCWHPNEPSETSTATLRFEPATGAYLCDVAGPIGGFGQQFDGLLWESHLGERFTCVGCYAIERRGFPPNCTSKLLVRRLYKGIHLTSPKDARVTRVRFLYSNLHRWLRQVPKARLVSAQNHQALVEIRSDPLWDCALQDGFRIKNFATIIIKSDEDTFHLHFVSEEGIELAVSEAAGLRQFHEIERKFRSLIDVLSDGKLEPSSIHAEIDGKWIEIFAKRRIAEPIDLMYMPVPFEEVRNRIADVITRWMALQGRVESAVELYLLASHTEDLDLENQFLCLMRACEAVHRTLEHQTYFTGDEYKSRIQPQLLASIPQGLPEAFVAKLKSTFRYANEKSLRKRLEEMVTSLPNQGLFELAKDKCFVEKTVATRNFLIHRDLSGEPDAWDFPGLYKGVLLWREAILAIFLGSLGFDDAAICQQVGRLRARNDPQFWVV